MSRFLILLALLLPLFRLQAQSPVFPPGFVFEEFFVTGLSSPTDLKIAADGRIFITEKSGKVRIIEHGELLPQPFYTVNTQTPYERGLDGIVLDPDFENNGYIYLYYTLADTNQNILVRVTAGGNTAVPGSEIELFRFDPMWASFHNGGGMAFDTSGCLLVGVGDGTSHIKAQLLTSNLGKIIRLHPDGSIPTDNPFYTTAIGNYRAIAAYGIRNPFTMAVSRITGRVFFNDVGNNLWEEVNEYQMGGNYGWHLVEGYLNGGTPPDSNYRDPIHAYDHNFGCAVVGATFYEPDVSLFPNEYSGKYFFHEMCKGKLMCMNPSDSSVSLFGTDLGNSYSNLESSPDGYLYMLSVINGNLGRISYRGLNAPPIISKHPKSIIAAVGEDVTFSTESPGINLTYRWFRDGLEVYAGKVPSWPVVNVQMTDSGSTFFVRVENDFGFAYSDTVVLSVINGTRPFIQFLNIPATYAAGDTIPFAASVTDADQTLVPLADWTWEIDFHHDEHVHPALTATSGIASGIYAVETFGEVDTNVFFSIRLTVTDNSGLTGENSIDVLPQKVDLLIHSRPTEIGISIDGSEVKTNFDLRSVSNLNRTIEVPPYGIVGDTLFRFVDWHDGSDSMTRTFHAANRTLFLNYTAVQEYFTADPDSGTMIIFADTSADKIPYKYQRVNQVNEYWEILSPYPFDQPPFPTDYFSVRWEGGIVSPVTDTVTFYLKHDGKASLKVGNDLLIDGSVGTSIYHEDSVQIYLHIGDSLPIIVDYDHHDYLSRIRLDWRYSLVERHTVPFMTIHPDTLIEPPVTINGIVVFPNPSNQDILNIGFDPVLYPSGEAKMVVYDPRGRKITESSADTENRIIPLDIAQWAPGMYFVKISVGADEKVIRFFRTW